MSIPRLVGTVCVVPRAFARALLLFTTVGLTHGLAVAAGDTPAFPSPPASGNDTSSAAPASETTGNTHALPAVQVTGARSFAEKNQLPQTTESITAKQIGETINATDSSDALKYLPDVLVRKRYIGDTQAPMSTRTTGINASARSLIYADGVLLSTLINNNNQNGSPQWFMVSPGQIERVDVLYGPFAAQFPGNSYGAVTEITTRMPTKFEASVDVQGAIQHFGLYDTHESEPSQQYSATLGDKLGKLSWFVSASHLDSFSQPITIAEVAQSTTPAAANLPVVTGAIADRNRTGQPIQVIGASNFIHTIQDNASLKVAYDFTPTLSATYALGYWQNNQKARAQTYLQTANGTPFFGATSGSVNIGGFAYSASTIAGQFTANNVDQQHLMQSLTVDSHTQGPFDWQLIVSNFYYLQDLSGLSTGVYPTALAGGPGRTTDMGGTGWTTVDLKGTWRPQGIAGANIVSFGGHFDQFKLVSQTFNTTNWASQGEDGSLFSNSLGNTQTFALWAQDVWRIAPSLQATLGGRYEMWRAYNGFNFATGSNGVGVAVNQPSLSRNGFSPKASLRWDLTDIWSITGSFGKALRFPTVGELYQTVQTGTTFVQANPFLKPESVLSGELALERDVSDGRMRLSVFDEYVSNALISQTATVPGFPTPVSFTQNVGKTRETGVEIAGSQDNVLISGLTLSGNVTYVDARILEDDGFVSTTGSTAVGKQVPNVPTWRATLAVTYRPDSLWAFTLAGRYSSRMFSTVDNSDINPATFQGFQSYFVMDARVHLQLDKHWGAALGVDNLNNRKYFLFHPFPQRTFYAELRYDL
ncbi:TonB-dependent receptor [Paraburkholderia rhizosphaerae]|uniref:Iron complex outermembrane receptor protein n=1 Tax=Paraburkholderia rhizosphaerae TaxID=480658 RepID=A0A4R8LZL0_9BURK|nr:TonB-dependent receptor [Paraburkholderia rhizosphaerae]TDY54127.1 iron complex outermembrane receptor protein [Paraburkholderia rhizosphaerae]